MIPQQPTGSPVSFNTTAYISGAEKTTAYMESVLKTFGLTDHRKDASFQEWEELSLTYQKQAARYTKEIRKKNAAVTLTAVQSVIP